MWSSRKILQSFKRFGTSLHSQAFIRMLLFYCSSYFISFTAVLYYFITLLGTANSFDLALLPHYTDKPGLFFQATFLDENALKNGCHRYGMVNALLCRLLC